MDKKRLKRLLRCVLGLTALGVAACDGTSAPSASAIDAGELAQVEFPVGEMVVGGRFKIKEIVDGDTVTLSNGRDVRMVGTQAPKLPLGRRNFEAWPLGDAAKDQLEALADEQEVTLYFGGRDVDRHGRWLAHLVRTDELWLQGAMLEAGFARVYTFDDNRGAIRAMLQAESIARAANRGIWAHPYYAIRTPEELSTASLDFLNTFQIVTGTVVSTGEGGGRLFINFSEDWSTDFTAVITPGAARRYSDAPEFDRNRLDGAKIELRGWIEINNGPTIEISHPEQIVYLP